MAEHRLEQGHERCHESDEKLYKKAGLGPLAPNLPACAAEHRRECDRWRAGRYNLPLETEPLALLKCWLTWYGRPSHEAMAALREADELAHLTRRCVGVALNDDDADDIKQG